MWERLTISCWHHLCVYHQSSTELLSDWLTVALAGWILPPGPHHRPLDSLHVAWWGWRRSAAWNLQTIPDPESRRRKVNEEKKGPRSPNKNQHSQLWRGCRRTAGSCPHTWQAGDSRHRWAKCLQPGPRYCTHRHTARGKSGATPHKCSVWKNKRTTSPTHPFSPLLMNFCTSFTPRRMFFTLAAAEGHRLVKSDSRDGNNLLTRSRDYS